MYKQIQLKGIGIWTVTLMNTLVNYVKTSFWYFAMTEYDNGDN